MRTRHLLGRIWEPAPEPALKWSIGVAGEGPEARRGGLPEPAQTSALKVRNRTRNGATGASSRAEVEAPPPECASARTRACGTDVRRNPRLGSPISEKYVRAALSPDFARSTSSTKQRSHGRGAWGREGEEGGRDCGTSKHLTAQHHDMHLHVGVFCARMPARIIMCPSIQLAMMMLNE